jgi:hypothetical protein
MTGKIQFFSFQALCLLTILQVHATVFSVAVSGNDANPGTQTSPWRTVQKAASTLVAGDTVLIRGGVYHEQVVVQNSGTKSQYITFKDYPGETPIIDGSGISPLTSNAVFATNEQSFLRISGLKVQNSDYFGIGNWGAWGATSKPGYIVVERCTTFNTVGSGIAFSNHTNITIDGNKVEQATTGASGTQENISVHGVDTFEIKNNHVSDGPTQTIGAEGIDAKGGSKWGTIHHNIVDNNKLCMYVDAWDGTNSEIDIYNNIFRNCGRGIVLASENGGRLENIRIFNNLVYNSKMEGLLMTNWVGVAGSHYMSGIHIINNTFFNNGSTDAWAPSLSISNPEAINVVIRNNIVSSPQYGGVIAGTLSVSQMTIENNLFQGVIKNGMGGVGSVTTAPLFQSSASGDFHLTVRSPAINTGTTQSAPIFDFDNAQRPSGSAIDMGAYEYREAQTQVRVPRPRAATTSTGNLSIPLRDLLGRAVP